MDGSGALRWWVDASFAVHQDMKSHTGLTMSMGKGSVISSSTWQKINMKSSTEAELVGVDDGMTIITWMHNFMKGQGFDFKDTSWVDERKMTGSLLPGMSATILWSPVRMILLIPRSTRTGFARKKALLRLTVQLLPAHPPMHWMISISMIHLKEAMITCLIDWTLI
jgi:hypothetical protein